jgi:hypothetical protein
VAGAELRALESMDVPYFTALNDRLGPSLDEEVPTLWERAPIDEVRARLERATTDALPAQLAALRAALQRCPDPANDQQRKIAHG